MLIFLKGQWYGSVHYSPAFHFGSSGSILVQSTWELFWTNWPQYSSSPCSFCLFLPLPFHKRCTLVSSTCSTYHQDKRVKPGNLWKCSFLHLTALDRNDRLGLLKICCTFNDSMGTQDVVLKQDGVTCWVLSRVSFCYSRKCSEEIKVSYVYWTVHHLDSWIKRDQLAVTCSIISLFNAQHVSDVNTSILRSLRLICWVISWVVLFWYDVCWCYVVVWLGWCGIRMQAEAVLQPAIGGFFVSEKFQWHQLGSNQRPSDL